MKPSKLIQLDLGRLNNIVFLLLFFPFWTFAQVQSNASWDLNRYYGPDTFGLVTYPQDLSAGFFHDSVFNSDASLLDVHSKYKLLNYFMNDPILNVKGIDYEITINPTSEFGTAYDFEDGALYKAGKGYYFHSTYKKWEIYSGAYNGFEKADDRITDYAVDTLIYPGFGGVKYNTGYLDYLMGYGGVEYTPNEHFHFSVGHGKNKIGEGYRSLFLSDVATSYPYARLDIQFWKFDYHYIIGQFTRFDNPINTAGLRQRKNGAFHYLNAHITKKFKLSFFEAVIFSRDSTNMGLELNYLNPFVAFRPVEYAIGSPDNMLLGGALTYLPNPRLKFYTQFLLDELKASELFSGSGWWANKYAFQLGIDSKNSFGIKGLNTLIEYNRVRPFTYTHFDVNQNYGHMMQPLAHPSGANFEEIIGMFHYRNKRFIFSNKFLWKSQGFETDFNATIGADINISYENRASDYNNDLGQGDFEAQIYNDFRVGYIFNPKQTLVFEVSVVDRSRHRSAENKHDTFIALGFRTLLFNFYRDF